MGVAYCLVTPAVADRLKDHWPAVRVDEPMAVFGDNLLHICVRGPAVPDRGTFLRQVAFHPDGSVTFPPDLDT